MNRRLAKLFVLISAFGVMASAMGADEELRFSWWGGGPRHEVTLKAIKLFEEKNPGITIKAEYGGYGGYFDRVVTQIAGGTEPDIMQIEWAWLTSFSKDGNGFYDLYQSRDLIKIGDFSPEGIRMGVINGKLNALPTGLTARVFVWNKDSLAKAGVKMPATWEDLFAVGKQYRKNTDDKGWLIDGDVNDVLLITHAYIYQKYGTPYLDPKTSKVAMSETTLVEWAKLYKRLSDENIVIPLPHRKNLGANILNAGWDNGLWAGTYMVDSILAGRTSLLPKQGKEVEVGPFLMVKGAKNSGVISRPAQMFAVSKNSKHPQTAAKFVNFLLTDPDAARTLGMTRGIPASNVITAMFLKENRIQPNEMKSWQQIGALRRAGKITPSNPLFENARLQAFMWQTFEQVVYGLITPEQAGKMLLNDGNALLEKIQ